ncbi:hypothetical protein PFICI_08883 [Pestalotiopsis fici W106-1]|uniref:Uncharacterized protein n=1 Tax=Pestalotiopsis fici (strain W106-1 / CGMCC3.15140) TaxID=1229662 RepID=W3WYU6_PESFW|nr:uncharacterized protein PFICI_08883 [Pestalotiopsis fici W106-1]ETS79030.1 hypothetical protein PFICI_08883 [Pestalotiopsis fici W106-1]
MSSSMIAKATTLKPEIRLAQSVSEFEASLSDEHKAAFRSSRSQSLNKPPDPSDVMRLTAEIDRRVVQQNGGGQCFGPRLTNILQAVQQYAALGDVIIGGSQNIIACGIWSLLRLTLLALVSFSAYMDKLSKLLMVAGRKAPRYEQMALLYPRSSDLQSSLSEYFIVVVQLCRQLYKSSRRTTLGSVFSFLSDIDLKEHETSLQLWADCIKDEVTLLTARKITEQSASLGVLSKNSQHESHRKRLQTRFRILQACSTYDHQTTWKEIRKSGNSTILAQLNRYSEWKAEAQSHTLLCTGKLGFGKSVLLANMVDDLNLSSTSAGTAVIYFFCRHDIQESLRARTIIGSIARQLINTILDRLPDEFIDRNSVSNLDDLLEFVLRVVPRAMKAFLVLDGLDECADNEIAIIWRHLKRLQESFTFNICCSFRTDVHLKGPLESAQMLLHVRVAQLPEENPDISTFITAELARCIDSGRLCIGDSTLIQEIQHVLVHRAEGMFLWVILQIASLCTAQSDAEIREALEDLPKGLPETFSRILQKYRGAGEKYQDLILQLCLAAQRPLTTEQLREALSVVPYNTEWNPARLINNILSVLSFCGSLITIDEENLTVRFLHHSVKQYLLGDFDPVDKPILTLEDANRTMGEVIVTYLNYNTFENAISTTVIPEIMAQDMPSDIVKSAFRHSMPVRHVALSMFKRRLPYQHDLRNTLIRARNTSRENVQFEFHAYAQAFWLWHVQWVFNHQDARSLDLLMTLLKKKRVNINDKDELGNKLLFKAMSSSTLEVVKRFLDYGSDIYDVSVNGCTALHMAAYWDRKDIIMCLIDSGARIEAMDLNGMTSLMVAASEGRQKALQCLLESGANIQASTPGGMSALSLAAYRGHLGTIQYLLEHGASNRRKDKYFRTPLLLAALRGHRQAVKLLAGFPGEDLETRDSDGRTAVSLAAYQGHEDVVKSLLNRGADIETRNSSGWTPLMLSATAGHAHVVNLLLDRGANIENKGSNGCTPLLSAIEKGHRTVVQSLIDRGANVLAMTQDGSSALQIANSHGDEVVTQLVVDSITVVKPRRKTNVRTTAASSQAKIQHDVHSQKDVDYTAFPSEVRTPTTVTLPPQFQSQQNANHASDAKIGLAGSSNLIAKSSDLIWAAHNGHDALVMFLISYGAHVEVQDEQGATPLLRAAEKGHISTMKFLQSRSANIHARTSDGKTALHISAKRGHLNIMQFMLYNGINVHARDWDGKTALHISAERGHLDMVQLLLAHGARHGDDLLDRTTALHLSAKQGHVQVVKCLLDHGAIVDIKNRRGKTALSLARKQGHDVVVKYLLDHGATEDTADP